MEEIIKKVINKYIKDNKYINIEFSVDHPRDLNFGDYFTNVAIIIAQKNNTTTDKIAQELVIILKNSIEQIENIDIAGPGFINISLKRNFFTTALQTIEKKGTSWGKNEKAKNETILIEHINPNLFKILHIGNLVGTIYGESIARILAFSGGKVFSTVYASDVGLTVAKAVWGVQHTNADIKEIKDLGKSYKIANDAFEDSEKSNQEIKEINKKIFEQSDPKINEIVKNGKVTSLNHVYKIMDILGSKFDFEIFESQAGKIGLEKIEETKGIFENSDGAIIFRGEKYGLHTRVFVNSMGFPTYEAKDIGNFLLKQKKYPSWDKMIIITSVEQKEYFKVILKVLSILFEKDVKDKSIEHFSNGNLSLTTGKMSSRKGNILASVDMLESLQIAAKKQISSKFEGDKEKLSESIAVATLKYQVLRQDISLNIIFDPKKAIAFNGATGPYLQYTHVRIDTLLQKSKEMKLKASLNYPPDCIFKIERLIYRFPNVVLRAYNDKAPHYINTYLTQLASEFNTFYSQEKILDSKNPDTPYKLAMIKTVQQTLKNGLYLLGIEAPERM